MASLATATSHAPCALLPCRAARRRPAAVPATCSAAPEPGGPLPGAAAASTQRRQLLAGAAALAAGSALDARPAAALGFQKDMDAAKKRKLKIPESEYRDGPDGLKIFDVELGKGALAEEGRRVVVHFDCKWRGVTFITTRQGMGVTGGTPLGFDVGASPGAGGTLKGLDLGVRGMRVGGRRKLIVPPQLAYGDKGVGEIPPGATLDFDVELLSIKQDAIGYRVKVVEG